MAIKKDDVVEIEYTLKDNSGKVIDTSVGREPLPYLHGHKNIVPGLEKELDGKSEGDEFTVTVSPSEGYGERNDSLVRAFPKEELSNVPNLEIGIQLQADTPQGPQILTVVAMNEKEVTLDANHPLAGVTLNFDIRIMKIREASKEELEHGHVHGPGGHHH